MGCATSTPTDNSKSTKGVTGKKDKNSSESNKFTEDSNHSIFYYIIIRSGKIKSKYRKSARSQRRD